MAKASKKATPPRGRCTKTSTAREATWKTGIKEQQLDLFADRTSAHTMRANQLRLWFLQPHERHARHRPQGHAPGERHRGTIRLKLLKLGAQLKISVRRFTIHFASACPYQDVFRQAWTNLQHYPIRS